ISHSLLTTALPAASSLFTISGGQDESVSRISKSGREAALLAGDQSASGRSETTRAPRSSTIGDQICLNPIVPLFMCESVLLCTIIDRP
ncbi:hypothetical protein PMAYCL1PPCAC_25136, partial [Pristionchus mayeri]